MYLAFLLYLTQYENVNSFGGGGGGGVKLCYLQTLFISLQRMQTI